jgi:hypothetical protein
MTNCPSEYEISQYIDRELDKPRSLQIKIHLETCKICKKSISEWKMIDHQYSKLLKAIPLERAMPKTLNLVDGDNNQIAQNDVKGDNNQTGNDFKFGLFTIIWNSFNPKKMVHSKNVEEIIAEAQSLKRKKKLKWLFILIVCVVFIFSTSIFTVIFTSNTISSNGDLKIAYKKTVTTIEELFVSSFYSRTQSNEVTIKIKNPSNNDFVGNQGVVDGVVEGLGYGSSENLYIAVNNHIQPIIQKPNSNGVFRASVTFGPKDLDDEQLFSIIAFIHKGNHLPLGALNDASIIQNDTHSDTVLVKKKINLNLVSTDPILEITHPKDGSSVSVREHIQGFVKGYPGFPIIAVRASNGIYYIQPHPSYSSKGKYSSISHFGTVNEGLEEDFVIIVFMVNNKEDYPIGKQLVEVPADVPQTFITVKRK